MLLLENCHLDSMVFYQFAGNKLIAQSLQGDLVKFSTRTYKYRFPNVVIQPGVNEVFVRISGIANFRIPILLLSQEDFYQYTTTSQFVYFIYLGILLLALVVYFFLIRSLQKKIHIYYFLSILALGIVVSYNNGYLYKYIYPDFPLINLNSPSIYALMGLVLLFSEHFLEIKTRAPKLRVVYFILYLLHIAVIVANISGYFIFAGSLIGYLWIVSPLFLLAITAYIYLKTRSAEVKYLLFSWSFFLSFVVLYVLSIRKIIPQTSIQNDLLIIGVSLEVVFMFLAVVKHFEKVGEAHKELLQEQNRLLEDELKLRTAEIVRTNESLQEQNKELSLLKEQSDDQKEILARQNHVIEEQNKILHHKKINLEELVSQKTEFLLQAQKALDERNNRFDQFAFIAAHKLRGPVATLKGILNLGKSGFEGLDRSIMLRESESTLEKLDSIIKELIFVLDMPRNIKDLKEITEIPKIIEEVHNQYAKELEAINGSILLRCTNLPTILSAPLYIESILSSLISNSIRFRSFRRDLKILISCSFDVDGIYICVSDNGQGLDLEIVSDKLFSPFQRFHEDSGKGLGLFVLKSQLDALNATINVTENTDHGLTFKIFLPFN